jgi:hypothetical protein
MRSREGRQWYRGDDTKHSDGIQIETRWSIVGVAYVHVQLDLEDLGFVSQISGEAARVVTSRELGGVYKG